MPPIVAAEATEICLFKDVVVASVHSPPSTVLRSCPKEQNVCIFLNFLQFLDLATLLHSLEYQHEQKRVKGHRNPLFFGAFFFPFCPVLPQAIFLPKSPLSGTSNVLLLVEKRQLAGAGFWGRFWTGSPHRKKGKSFFFLALEKRA